MIGPIIAAVVIVFVLIIIVSGYKKAPPDTAYIISGLRKKVIIGKASVKIPFLERMDKLSLKLIAIDVKTSNAVPTADYINIQVDAAVNIKISSEKDKLALAAENFLNQNTQYIASIAREVLEGNMREIVGRMRLEEMVSDRQKFANLVKENAEPDLAAMGLDIVSFNVQNFADKQANDARINAEREIAKKNNELALQKAELQKMEDTKRAEADAAYSIQEQEQRKTIEVATQEASIAKQEKEVILKQKEAEVKEKSLDAEFKKKAEAEKFARQQQSEAELYERMKNAEAEKFEREKEAEAMKATAEAQKFAKEQEAAGIRMVGEAEAEAIRAKGIAEAEAMEKKALAYQKYNNAAMAEMLIQVLPEIAGKIAEPLTQIDKITIIGGDGGNGVGNVADNVPSVMAKLFETMKETVGIDLADIVKAGTYDAKVNKNINVTGLSGDDKKDVVAAVSGAVMSDAAENNESI